MKHPYLLVILLYDYIFSPSFNLYINFWCGFLLLLFRGQDLTQGSP